MSDIVYEHKDVLPEGRHKPYNYEFDTTTEMMSLTSVGAEKRWSLALDKSTGDIYVLASTNPVNWQRVTFQGEGIKPSGGAGGHLYGMYPNPLVLPDSHRHTPGITIPHYPSELPPSGAAGGSLAGSYPNPTLTTTGVTPGNYIAPTIRVSAEGRIESITSSGNIALLSGSNFTGPVTTTRDLNIQGPLYIRNTLTYTVHTSSGSSWTPLASSGVVQRRTLTGNGNLNGIVGANAGMEFKLVIHQDNVGGRQLSFTPNYKFPEGANRLIAQDPLAISLLSILVIDPITYLCSLNSNFT